MDSWSEDTESAPVEGSFDDENLAADDAALDDATGDDPAYDDEAGEDEPSLADDEAEPNLVSEEEFDLEADDDAALDDSTDPPHEPDPVDHDPQPDFDVVDAEVPGTDPDASAVADDEAFTAEFPPDIELDTMPDPVDGAPWADADLLGDVADPEWNTMDMAPPMNDLYSMDGVSGGGWDGLLASDDAAVSSLARWWQP